MNHPVYFRFSAYIFITLAIWLGKTSRYKEFFYTSAAQHVCLSGKKITLSQFSQCLLVRKLESTKKRNTRTRYYVVTLKINQSACLFFFIFTAMLTFTIQIMKINRDDINVICYFSRFYRAKSKPYATVLNSTRGISLNQSKKRFRIVESFVFFN